MLFSGTEFCPPFPPAPLRAALVLPCIELRCYQRTGKFSSCWERHAWMRMTPQGRGRASTGCLGTRAVGWNLRHAEKRCVRCTALCQHTLRAAGMQRERRAFCQESRVVTHVLTDKISHAQAESPAPVLKRSGTPFSPLRASFSPRFLKRG